MKHTIVILLMLAIAATGMAQETQPRVFQQIYNSAMKTANDPGAPMPERKAASFRADAVNYLSNRTPSEIADTTKALKPEEIAALNSQLDSMAYFMYDYVNIFNKEYSRAKGQKDKARVLRLFREVSINNPLYNDPDRQLVLAYYNREDFLTQFSLDTNWVKAVGEVKKRLREM